MQQTLISLFVISEANYASSATSGAHRVYNFVDYNGNNLVLSLCNTQLAYSAHCKVFATFMVSNVSQSAGYLKKCFSDICTQKCVVCLGDMRLLQLSNI